MKNNKGLIILAVILMNVLVLFTVGQSFLGKSSDYELKLAEARSLAEQDLCQRSVNCYNEALSYKETLDVRTEMVEVYKQGIQSGELGRSTALVREIKEMTELYPKEAAAYETACNFLLEYDEYKSCAEILMKADDLHVTSKKLKKILEKVRYKNKITYTVYADISSLYEGSYLAFTGDSYTMLNTELSEMVGYYSYASSFSKNYAFVRTGNPTGDYSSFLIDRNGVRQCYFEGVTESSGVGFGLDEKGNEILLLAGKNNKKYKYYTVDGEEAFGDYLFAGRFRNNVAAVQEKKGEWKLINAAGQPITETVFEDVILNEFDECAAKGLIFAKTKGKYYLYNTAGEKVGDFSCDGAKAFIENITAFKSGEKWGFVNTEGEVVLEPQYENAKAFSKGLAGVQKNGTWNFIDSNNKVAIEGDYEEAGYFCENGKCFVKKNGRWIVLNMYYIAD